MLYAAFQAENGDMACKVTGDGQVAHQLLQVSASGEASFSMNDPAAGDAHRHRLGMAGIAPQDAFTPIG